MSDNYPKLNSHSNKRFSEIISEGVKFFFQNWKNLIVPLGLFFIVSLIIKNLLFADLIWQVQLMGPAIEVIIGKDPSLLNYGEIEQLFKYLILDAYTLFLNDLISTIFNVIAMCLVSNYLYNRFLGNNLKMIPELKNGLNRRLILVVLLLGVGISVGTILLLIPSIIIFGFYIFYIFTYHSDDSERPLKEARNMAKGAFWKVIGIFIVNYLEVFVCDSVYQLIINNLVAPLNISSWYNPSTRDYGSIILYDFVINIVQFLFTPLFICLLTSLYVHLKTRIEQNIQYQISFQEAPKYYETPIDKISNVSGIYCPFCGNYLSKSERVCPQCGEKLNFVI